MLLNTCWPSSTNTKKKTRHDQYTRATPRYFYSTGTAARKKNKKEKDERRQLWKEKIYPELLRQMENTNQAQYSTRSGGLLYYVFDFECISGYEQEAIEKFVTEKLMEQGYFHTEVKFEEDYHQLNLYCKIFPDKKSQMEDKKETKKFYQDFEESQKRFFEVWEQQEKEHKKRMRELRKQYETTEEGE